MISMCHGHIGSNQMNQNVAPKNIFLKGGVTLSCIIKRMLSIQEKELWKFDLATTI